MRLQPNDKSMTIHLKTWGDLACFTRPEMKVERVSYAVITPSAARGLLEAILYKPQFRWRILVYLFDCKTATPMATPMQPIRRALIRRTCTALFPMFVSSARLGTLHCSPKSARLV